MKHNFKTYDSIFASLPVLLMRQFAGIMVSISGSISEPAKNIFILNGFKSKTEFLKFILHVCKQIQNKIDVLNKTSTFNLFK